MKTIVKAMFPALIVAGTLNAQVVDVIPKNGGENMSAVFEPNGKLYVDEMAGNKRKVPADYLRQGNISWEKRVWRTIDLREKINQPLMFPIYPTQNRISLLDLIKKGIQENNLAVFSDDEFGQRLSKEQALARFSITRTIKIYDSTGTWLRDSTVLEEMTSDKITQYKIKEDWYFEKERSVQEVRILGICPVYYDEDKQLYIDKGWIYFPQAQNMMSKTIAYTPKNDVSSLSYEDVFQKRLFNSYISKESNVMDRYISQYAVGLDALVEADKVKGDIFTWEHNLWNF